MSKYDKDFWMVWVIKMNHKEKLILIPFAWSDWKKVPIMNSPTQKWNHVLLEKNYFQPRFSLFRANKRHWEISRERLEQMSHFQWRHLSWPIFNDVLPQNGT